ncbi:GrdX family protein [Lutispora sp.]|uniref:GrdX family protein n=1 Tax=Lutispora sp. TaxID=2828727 RepID=UPI003567D4E9
MVNLTKNIQIITNNVSICDLFNKNINVTYVDGGYLDVLYEVRDRIHTGSILISHPLMGSIKPNETPYRSIVLENRTGPLDYQSLSIIESSIENCKKLLKDRTTPDWTDKVLADFRFLDMKLLESALASLE